MRSDHKRPHPEASEDQLAEELTDEDQDQLSPLDTQATRVSEADWVEQQLSVPVDDDDERAD